METTTNPQRLDQTAQRGVLFDWFNRGLLTSHDLTVGLVLVKAGLFYGVVR